MSNSDWVVLLATIVGGIYCLIQIGDRLWKNKQRKEDRGTNATERREDRAVVREVGERMHCSDRVEAALIELTKQVTALALIQAESSTAARLNAETATNRHNELLRELERRTNEN